MGLAGGSPTWFEAGASPSLDMGSRVPPNRDAGLHLLGLSCGDLTCVPQPRAKQDVTCTPLPQ